MSDTVWWIIGAVVLAVVWFWFHQRRLAAGARLMQDAIRNRDFTFRLPTRFMFSGERALQETLNQLGEHVREQVNLGEVESWEKLTRVLTHEIMNATAPIASISQMMLHHPAVKDSDLEEGINAIHNTVTHLNSFVDGYRKFSALQKPVPQMVDLIEVVNDVEQLFGRMRREYDSFWTDERVRKADSLGLSREEVITLASIVESETNRKIEYPQIAALYLNRLRKGMFLQACPTVIFASGNFNTRRVLNRHLAIDSPYNTYKNLGLPPGPIRCPLGSTVDAVLNAPPTRVLYMCANPDFSGTHVFSVTFAQHAAVARRYQAALNERGIK